VKTIFRQAKISGREKGGEQIPLLPGHNATESNKPRTASWQVSTGAAWRSQWDVLAGHPPIPEAAQPKKADSWRSALARHSRGTLDCRLWSRRVLLSNTHDQTASAAYNNKATNNWNLYNKWITDVIKWHWLPKTEKQHIIEHLRAGFWIF